MNGSRPVQMFICRRRGLLMLICSRVHKGLEMDIGPAGSTYFKYR